MNYPFGHPGSDLSSYREGLSRVRSTRTLSLRRISRPTIAGSFGVSSTVSQTNRYHVNKTSQFQAFTVDNTIEILNSRNETQIIDHCSKIIELSSQPNILNNLAQSEDLCQVLLEFLSDSFQEQTKIIFLSVIGILFPLSGSLQEQYSDGLALIFLEFLESDNADLIFHSICLISIISDVSGYARDTILAFGISDYLIQVALTESNDDLTVASCNAIYHIYASPEDIDIQVMQDSVPSLKSLFELSNTEALKSVILTFNELANKNPSIVYIYFDNGVYDIAMQLLGNPEFVSEALVLVGNLCSGKRQHIQLLLESNLYPMLMDFYRNEDLKPTVLWVLSNLVESSAPLVMPLIDDSFISDVIVSANDSSFEVKKESAYFMSTLIIYVASDELPMFISQPVAESLVEMCNSGVSLVVTKCLNALLRLFMFVQSASDGGEFMDFLQQSELHDTLNEIISSDIDKAKEPATTLLMLLDSVQQE